MRKHSDRFASFLRPATLPLCAGAGPCFLKRLYHQLRTIVVSPCGIPFQVLADNMKVAG